MIHPSAYLSRIDHHLPRPYDADAVQTQFHRAPWGRPLRLVSILATVLCAAIAVSLVTTSGAHGLLTVAGVIPLAIVFGSLPFAIRGYRVDRGILTIRRLFWETHIPLDGLVSASAEPRAMKSSLRTCGNGGLFSFTGWYWNKQLGHYRAYVTDLDRTVVLRFPKRTLVLSPDNPESFVGEFQDTLQVA